MKILPLLALMVILVTNANALDSLVAIELYPSGAGKEVVDVSFIASQDAEEISYSLVSKPENIKIYGDDGEMEYGIVENEFYEIVIKQHVRRGQSYRIKMLFDIKGLVEQVDDKYIFSFKYIPVEVDNFNFELKLPRGFVLADISSAISPAGYKINSDGKIIMLNWQLQRISDEQSFIVVYERGIYNDNSSILWIAVLIAIAIGAAGYYIYHIKGKHKQEKKEIVDNVLSQDEKKIVEMIKNVAEITQKQVVKETGFSKAKVSKIIRRLEEKGIVDKIPYMATNKLRIKDKIR